MTFHVSYCQYVYMSYVNFYPQYLKSMENVWSDSAYRSESCRLNRLWDYIDGNPQKLWDAMADYHPNARATYWTRVTTFYEWCIEEKLLPAPNPYRVWRKKNKRCFQNVYQRRPCKIPYEEAKAKLLCISNEAHRNKALQLLEGGLRFSESFTLKDSFVIGKGNKPRRVYCREIAGPCITPSQYSSFLRTIKGVLGVGPHKLRSIMLSTYYKKTRDPKKLKDLAGWASYGPTDSYVAEFNDEMEKEMREIQGGISSNEEVEVPARVPKVS